MLSTFIGWETAQGPSGTSICQEQCIGDLLSQYGMSCWNESINPCYAMMIFVLVLKRIYSFLLPSTKYTDDTLVSCYTCFLYRTWHSFLRLCVCQKSLCPHKTPFRDDLKNTLPPLNDKNIGITILKGQNQLDYQYLLGCKLGWRQNNKTFNNWIWFCSW